MRFRPIVNGVPLGGIHAQLLKLEALYKAKLEVHGGNLMVEAPDAWHLPAPNFVALFSKEDTKKFLGALP